MKHTDGVSILCAVRYRSEALIRSLPSWLESGADQIVIIDYSSEPTLVASLEKEGISDPRIQIFRIDGKSVWWLADAFNSGIDQIENTKVLKLDADHKISPELLSHVKLGDREFFTGHWSNPLPGQSHTNGAVFLHTEHLKSVGGWDPRITTYGWDDSDLYERLTYFGLRRHKFPNGFIEHRDHSDSERLNDKDLFGFQTKDLLQAYAYANQVVTREFLPWKGPEVTSQLHSQNSTNADTPDPKTTRSRRNTISAVALGKMMNWIASEPDKAKMSLSAQARGIVESVEGIYSRYLSLKSDPYSPDFDPPTHWKKVTANEVILHAQGDLGDRLLALASGFQHAQRIGAKLSLVWLTDALCNAEFGELFRWGGEVIEDENILQAKLAASKFKTFDWSEKQPFFEVQIARMSRGTIYMKSSNMFLMDSPDSGRIAKRFLQNLIPVAAVRDLMALVPGDFEVAFHISQGDGAQVRLSDFESDSTGAPKSEQHIIKRRGSAGTKSFQLLVSYLAANSHPNPPPPVFVAADNRLTKLKILELLGPSARSVGSRLGMSGSFQMQEALAEMYLLARAPLFIGSAHSSFSKVANLVSTRGQTFEQVGERYFPNL